MMKFMHATPLMRAPEAADYLGLSPSTLAKMRHRKTGPKFLKLGPRVVAYKAKDLDAWINETNAEVGGAAK